MWPTRCMNGSIRESHRQHQQRRYACNRCMLILVCLGADLEQSVLIRERANECVDRVRAELTAPTFSSADSGEQNVEHAPVTTTYQRRPIPPMKRLLSFFYYYICPSTTHALTALAISSPMTRGKPPSASVVPSPQRHDSEGYGDKLEAGQKYLLASPGDVHTASGMEDSLGDSMIVGRYKSGCGWLSLDARTVTRGMTEGQRVED